MMLVSNGKTEAAGAMSVAVCCGLNQDLSTEATHLWRVCP